MLLVSDLIILTKYELLTLAVRAQIHCRLSYYVGRTCVIQLDHAVDGGWTDGRNHYVGYAEGDNPDGQTFFIYRLPWTQSFKWEARCTSGPNKGKILSTIERKFKTTGHWLWNSKREGRFL